MLSAKMRARCQTNEERQTVPNRANIPVERARKLQWAPKAASNAARTCKWCQARENARTTRLSFALVQLRVLPGMAPDQGNKLEKNNNAWKTAIKKNTTMFISEIIFFVLIVREHLYLWSIQLPQQRIWTDCRFPSLSITVLFRTPTNRYQSLIRMPTSPE